MSEVGTGCQTRGISGNQKGHRYESRGSNASAKETPKALATTCGRFHMRLRGPSSEGGGGVGGAPPAPPLPGSPRGSKGRRGPFTNEDLKMGGGRLSDSASPRRDAARRLRRAPCACLRQQRLIRRRAWGRGAHRARLAGGRTNPRQAAPVCYADVLINPIGPALTRLPPGNRHLSSPRAHLVQPWAAAPTPPGAPNP